MSTSPTSPTNPANPTNPTKGRVHAIYLTLDGGGDAEARDEVKAIAGAGLEGDRYGRNAGTFSKPMRKDPGQQLTLIEAEVLRALGGRGIDLAPGQHRRNIETEGIDLNALVGATFRVGGATIRGMRLCHPCGYLSKKVGANMIEHLENAGGLRCEIVTGGAIRVGDPIVIDA